MPGSLSPRRCSAFIAEAMAMKNNMITNTTSIMGAIWNPGEMSMAVVRGFFMLRITGMCLASWKKGLPEGARVLKRPAASSLAYVLFVLYRTTPLHAIHSPQT
ncbi:MAG: hypothetical protein JWO89_2326 [Verrucomicrobiaceae bacterium]|nr:hypothetical protein [Verrucomicrobiaceae bacterium]